VTLPWRVEFATGVLPDGTELEAGLNFDGAWAWAVYRPGRRGHPRRRGLGTDLADCQRQAEAAAAAAATEGTDDAS